MPRKRTYPGSIFVDRGKLYIKFKGKKYSTGLEPTKLGYRNAERILESYWLRSKNLDEPSHKRLRIREAFDNFKDFKYSRMEKTKVMYQLAYKAIISDNYFLDSEKVEKDVQIYVKTTKHSKVSINTYLTHLQIFLDYCTKKGLIPKTNFKSDYKTNPQKNNNQIWTDDEITKLVDYFCLEHPQLSLMIQFMLQTGARVVDCLTLTPENVNLENKVITWHNKVKKYEEPRPVSNKAVEILSKLPKYSDRIFPWNYSAKSFLNKKLRLACLDLGIKRNERSFQEFRVTFRMKLLESGIPKEYVMWLLRHKYGIVTEEHYTLYDHSKILEMLNK